jgi:hypothetical protein
VGIVILLGVLLLWLVVSGWLCARSYFEKGRLKGVEEGMREIIRGAQAHFPYDGAAIPKRVLGTMVSVKKVIGSRNAAVEPALWALGAEVGQVSWRKGYDEAIKLGAVPDGKIRLEISLNELLQLSWLAHLGFQHMMPNYRGFEIHRFSGAEDAREGARSVAILECSLPKGERPFADVKTQMRGREKLISDWWPNPAEREFSGTRHSPNVVSVASA